MKITKFKSLLVFLCLTWIVSDLFAQKGYQLGFVHYNTDRKNSSSNNLFLTNGIQGGVTYDIKLRNLIYLHTAGLLSVTYNSYKVGYNYRYNSMEIAISFPLQIKFVLPQTPNFDAFVFTGPTIKGSFARFGQMINTDLNQANPFTYVDEPFISRFTVFYGVGIGFKYKSIYIQGNYDWGIINPYKGFNSESFNIAIGKVL